MRSELFGFKKPFPSDSQLSPQWPEQAGFTK